jgi:hypothetical protein
MRVADCEAISAVVEREDNNALMYWTAGQSDPSQLQPGRRIIYASCTYPPMADL